MFTKNNKPATTPPVEPQRSVPAQDAVRGAANKPAAARAASIICADMKIHGSVTSEGALHIDGTVDGDVSATDITIGASGEITGEVKAEVVKVKGRIKGSIRARKVELETGAHVKGDIVHSSLQIQSNAVFEGQVKHAEDPLRDTGPVAASDTKPSVSASAPSAHGNGNGQSAGSAAGLPSSSSLPS
ncbi:MAG: polymer-forming cytoskeletal protein [Hyphomonas sp.]